jgi:hypothetical protein
MSSRFDTAAVPMFALSRGRPFWGQPMGPNGAKNFVKPCARAVDRAIGERCGNGFQDQERHGGRH